MRERHHAGATRGPRGEQDERVLLSRTAPDVGINADADDPVAAEHGTRPQITNPQPQFGIRQTRIQGRGDHPRASRTEQRDHELDGVARDEPEHITRPQTRGGEPLRLLVREGVQRLVRQGNPLVTASAGGDERGSVGPRTSLPVEEIGEPRDGQGRRGHAFHLPSSASVRSAAAHVQYALTNTR